MSSPNHPTSGIEDAFSSNFPNYIPASPDYVLASLGQTYSSSSNNSFGVVPIASPTPSLFHDDPYMKVMQAYYAKESPIPPPTIVPPSPILSPMFNPQEFFLPEELLMPPKRTSTSAAPAMTQAAIRQLVANSIATALEAQTANMANTDHTNGNTGPREAPVARKCSYKEFRSCKPFNFKGTEGVIGLISWFERTESVFSCSNCAEDCKVKFATGLEDGKQIRVVLAMCATYYLHLEQLDVKTAFLHGNLEEEIYMLQPEGFKQKGKENLVCRLNKSLYGLKQAPRCWYKRFDSFIRSLEYNRLHADPCAYFKRFGNDDFIILLLYVDDMLVAGLNKDHINKLKAQLARGFEMKDLGPANKILGMQIHRDRVSRKIWLSQKSYVKKILQRFNMQDCKPISTPFPTNVKLSSKMSPSSEKERMEILDITHAVRVVSRYMAKPGKEHWEAVKRILRYIKGTSDVALCFGESDLIVKGYVDWDMLILIKQSVVAMSTTEAEYVAAAQASKEEVWLKMLLEELGHEQEKITLFCDNQSTLYLARNPTFHSKTKYIRVQYHFVRKKVEEGIMDMQKIHIDDNVADYLTKAINCDKFIWCRSSCGLAET
ncbi:retrovirus-related pol polyprotein from transposon TNT 1-94 [Tanacetum coccineum]